MENKLKIINMISDILTDATTITTSTDVLFGNGVGGSILGEMLAIPLTNIEVGNIISTLSNSAIGGIILLLIILSIKKFINN